MPKSSMSTRQVLFYWFYVQTTDCLADGFLCHGRAITSVCVLSCKSQFVIILSYSLLPPIHDEHMHRDNRSFGNVDLCGNDLVVIDRLVPDLLLLLLISRALWIKRCWLLPILSAYSLGYEIRSQRFTAMLSLKWRNYSKGYQGANTNCRL